MTGLVVCQAKNVSPLEQIVVNNHDAYTFDVITWEEEMSQEEVIHYILLPIVGGFYQLIYEDSSSIDIDDVISSTEIIQGSGKC